MYRVLLSVLFLDVQRDFVGNGDDNVPELRLALLSLSYTHLKSKPSKHTECISNPFPCLGLKRQ